MTQAQAAPMSRARLAARAVERFNRRWPPGSPVRVWPGLMDVGPGVVVEVVRPGAHIVGQAPMVQVSGKYGAVDLLHVRRVPWEALPYTPQEDALLLQLAAEGLDEVAIARCCVPTTQPATATTRASVAG